MPKQAVIIFLKYPELGRSKTRLAASIGDENALKIYRELLEHTHQITKDLNCDRFLFYDKETPNKMDWEQHKYHNLVQIESDLGGRMKNAFEVIFNKGYQSVIIIGSDCYDLNETIINQAFDFLKQNEVVIGPALDGGYYLLGLTKMVNSLFEDVKWSTSEVFNATVSILEELNVKYDTTTPLSDIDVYEDLPSSLKKLLEE
jgi:rSAM/selenodomain-associated transferase 1